MYDRPMSRKQHERMSTIFLVSILSSYQESILLGRINSDSASCELAKDVESLFFNFFFDRRGSIPLRKPQAAMTIEEVLDIISDALDVISEERPDLIGTDYEGNFQLKEMRGQ